MSDAQTATMKRELQEQAARIKQLEADLKDTSRAGTVGAISADVSATVILSCFVDLWTFFIYTFRYSIDC